MIGASVYIIVCTAKNRLRVRLRRLKQPRYLIGAVVGAAYIYFSFFARFRAQSASAARRRGRNVPTTAAALAALTASGPALVGLAVMVISALAWLLPFDSGLLDFSASEVQFLFPAPVSRRSLLVHRLLRSQIGMLFGSLVVGLVTPSASGFSRLRIGIATWLLFCAGKVFFTGVSLSRAKLRSADATARRVARLPLLLTVVAIAIAGRALYQALTAVPIADFSDALNRLGEISITGAPQVAMWPFVALVRPIFAAWPGPFLLSLAGALAVLAGLVVWVLQSDATFVEATEQFAEKREQAAPSGVRPKYRAHAVGWPLATHGRPELAFAWKAAMQTFRVIDLRVLIRIVAILFALSIMTVSMAQRNGWIGALAMFALVGTVFSLLLAPQAIRLDMRQDLENLELLKTWPVRSADVVRGEILWPGLLITAMACTMIAFATVLSPALFTRMGSPTRFSLGAAAILLAPGLAFAQLAIQNGLALLFPAWVALGAQRSRGLDAMGQRLITLGGTLLALVVMTLPGAIAGGLVWLAFSYFIGPLAYVPGALVCSVILLVEVIVMTELLGPAYERLDLLAVERAE